LCDFVHLTHRHVDLGDAFGLLFHRGRDFINSRPDFGSYFNVLFEGLLGTRGVTRRFGW
jgi:hypothetical protein